MPRYHRLSVLLLLAFTFFQTLAVQAEEKQECVPAEHPGVKLLTCPIDDSLSSFNRPMETFNGFCVQYLVHPVSLVYNTVVPEPLQTGIDNFANNLLFPLHLTTNLLQGKFERAWTVTKRFTVNSTLGILGFCDPATHLGLPRCNEDFGQTLAVWGVGPGCYLNLPLLGPANVRDAITRIPDMFLNPACYVTGGTLVLNANSLFANAPFLNNYFASSNGTYATTRLAYTLAREAEINDGLFPPATSHPDESIGVLQLRPKHRLFYSSADQRSVHIPGTPEDTPCLPYLLFKQKQYDGRILFILPGLTSTKGNADILALAEMFHHAGFTVAVISSTFTPEFFTATATPLPGHLTRDCENLDRALVAIRDDIHQRAYAAGETSGITPVPTVFGVSLGAINTLHLAARDQQGLSQLNAKRFLAVNPPRDPLKALKTLDACFDLPLSWSADTRDLRARQTVQKIAFAILYPQEATVPNLDLEESRFLIGLNCRFGLLEIIRAAHLQGHDDLLKPLVRTDTAEHLEHDAFSLSYATYLETLLFPYLQKQNAVAPNVSFSDFTAQYRLDALAPHLRNNPKVRVFHNQNDLLINDDDIAWFRQTFGDRLVVFPRGGHLGNLIIPTVRQAIIGTANAPH